MTGTDMGRIGRCCVQVFLMTILIGWTGNVYADDVIVELEAGDDAFTVEQPAGTERLNVGAAGVGIGVRPPQAPLHVSGDIRGNFVADDGTDCPDGLVLIKSGGVWTCDTAAAGTGDITAVNTAGASGLTGGATAGDANLAVNFAATGGENGTGTQVSRSDHIHDSRYYLQTQLQDGSAQVNWNGLTNVPAGFADGTDDGIPYTAGDGLDLTATEFSVDFAGSGSATTVSHSDHNHDTAYYLQTQLQDGSAQVNWNSLTNVPAGFADGTDDGIPYTAGDGLNLTATEFSVNFAGSGSATTVSHSDHNHAAASLALAAVKELYQMVKERDAQVEELKTLVTQQQSEIVQLKNLIIPALAANPLYVHHHE